VQPFRNVLPDRRYYYQRYIPGRPCSALALAAGGRAVVIAHSEQLVGRPGAPFAYRGNIAPIPLPTRAAELLAATARTLAAAFGLVGLFGIDFILADDGTPWTVEVNPRYTAAAELVELATKTALLPWHRRACREAALETCDLPTTALIGKEILFAHRHGTFPTTCRWRPGDRSGCAAPAWADVPEPAHPLVPGQPILTVFARGRSLEQTRRRLARARDRARQRIEGD
jgi:predicted ATP-grasp superfamily ATP-dependent carboligase